jgi:hypothetical protein
MDALNSWKEYSRGKNGKIEMSIVMAYHLQSHV